MVNWARDCRTFPRECCRSCIHAQQSFSAKRKKKQNKSKATFDLKWLSEPTSALCISYRRVCQQSGYCLASLGLLISTLLWSKSLMDAHWPWKYSQRLEGRGSSLLGVFIMWKNVFFSFLFCSVCVWLLCKHVLRVDKLPVQGVRLSR